MSEPRHAIAVDWDGTCVVPTWPERTTQWMPGAVEALRDLSEHAYVYIWTARISPMDPFGNRRPPAEVEAEVRYIREMLDEAGLTQVDIYRGYGKPGATVYVDDKAERYRGREGSWAALTEKILARIAETPADFPALVRTEHETI